MDYKGLIVRSKRQIKNGNYLAPSNTLFLVDGLSRNGLSLTTDKCSCCGMQMFVTGVKASSVEILEGKSNAERLNWNKQTKYVKAQFGRKLIKPLLPMPEPQFHQFYQFK